MQKYASTLPFISESTETKVRKKLVIVEVNLSLQENYSDYPSHIVCENIAFLHYTQIAAVQQKNCGALGIPIIAEV